MWSMSWNELESNFEPSRALPYNETSQIRRREKERANFERLKLKQPPQNLKRRNTNRKSPLSKRSMVSNHILNSNRNKTNSGVTKYRIRNTGVSDLSNNITRSSRTPGKHISREQFNSMKSPRRGRQRGIGHGRSTFAGRQGIASPYRQVRGLRGMKK
jgi:hypothetical protein